MAKCPECGSEELYAEIFVRKILPLAAKRGSVKTAGVKIDQVEMKSVWDKESAEDGAEPAAFRGPVMCASCGARLVVCAGESDPRALEMRHARYLLMKYGLEELLKESGVDTEDWA
jgi:hypothetical protein